MSEPERVEVSRVNRDAEDALTMQKYILASGPRSEIIDVTADVTPLETGIENPIRILAIHKGTREKLFAPPVQPEMRGRRPSGVSFNPGPVPKEARGEPVVEKPVEYRINKRTAKSVVEELTGCGVQCREQGGRCFIQVIFPGERLEWGATDWFGAVASVKAWLDERRKGNFRVV